jgi:hypothetical protein
MIKPGVMPFSCTGQWLALKAELISCTAAGFFYHHPNYQRAGNIYQKIVVILELYRH